MADEVNPRQFSSLDFSDGALYGTETLLLAPPSSANWVENPFATQIDIARNLKLLQQARGTYVEPSYAKQGGRAQEWADEEIKAEKDAAFRQQVKEAKAAQEIQAQREQAQRTELFNKIKGEQGTPHPFETESELETVHRLLNLPPPVEGQPTPSTPPSTPNRQPTPSTGRPPPTANGTAARASSLVEPTATPAPAMLAEPISPPPSSGGSFDALPRSLPQAAGRFAIPGAFVVGDFAVRTFQGQSATQAAAGAVAGGVGAAAGGFVGAAAGTLVAGPVGGYVGAIVGGYIGGYVGGAGSDYFFQRPSPGTPPVEIPNYPPFRGGQAPRVQYLVKGEFDVFQLYTPAGVTPFVRHSTVQGFIFGPINSIAFQDGKDGGFIGLKIEGYDEAGHPITAFPQTGHGAGEYGTNPSGIEVSRADGTNEIYPDQTAPAPPPDNQPYYFAGAPLNGDNTIPSGSPAAGTKKGKNRDASPGIPPNNTPNGNGYFPGHGGLAPSSTPNPTQTPSNLGGNLPGTAPAPAPPPFAEPKDAPPPQFAPAPGGSGSPSADPGGSGSPSADPGRSTIQNGVVTSPPILTAQPIPLNSSPVTTPTSSPRTSRQNPTPDGVSPVPKAQLSPTPNTPEAAAQQQKKDFDEQITRLTTIGGLIAGLTPIVQGIPDAIAKSPAVQAANRTTTQGAVCEIAQPGGCLGDALDNNADKINQNNNKNTDSLLDKINAGANAAQLALLKLIDSKLGDLLPGGLSATFTRLWQTMQVDRIINILTLITTFHNGLMLSNNLGQTLFAAIDNISQAVGFKWKNEKGEESGFSSIVSEWTANFFKSIFGEENYTELVAEYKKANRIYQATANIFNALQSIGYSILSALEVVGSYVALIGNALRKWGEVGESAYKWFNPQPNFHNKFFTTLEGVTNVVSQIDQVASEVVSVEQNVAQIGELKNEIGKSIGEEDGSKQGVQPPEATKVKKSFDASKLASATGLELNDTDFESDESD